MCMFNFCITIGLFTFVILLSSAQNVEKYSIPLVNGGNARGNFFWAFHLCLKNGLQIPTPDTAEKSDGLIKYMNDNKLDQIWIAATDLAEEGKFFWMTTSEELNYTLWYSNQPDNAYDGEDCVEIGRFGAQLRWNDKNCKSDISVVCENGTTSLEEDIKSIFGNI